MKNSRGMFRTLALRNAPVQGPDRDEKVIRGCKIIQMGRVNDARPFDVDKDTLASVVALGAQSNKGLKARFTHPNMSDDGMGKYLGRWRNFRIEGDAVYADLYIADAAFDTPHGDLGSYVLALAEDDPEAFGVSLATVLDASMSADQEDPEATIPLRFSKLYAADVVDEPAATRGGLFDAYSAQDIPAQVTWILDHHFGDSTPEEIMSRFAAFLAKYTHGEFVMDETPELETVVDVTPSADEQAQDLSTEVTTADVVAESSQPAVDLAIGRNYVERFGDRGAVWFLEGKSLDECFALQATEMLAQLEQLKADKQDLQSRLDLALANTGEAEALSVAPELGEEARKKAAKEARAAEAQKKGASEAVARWSTMYPEN